LHTKNTSVEEEDEIELNEEEAAITLSNEQPNNEKKQFKLESHKSKLSNRLVNIKSSFMKNGKSVQSKSSIDEHLSDT
jgi:hypothetical protein